MLKGLVAEKWAANANATEYTFTIKKGLVFSNGDPVLPSSFKYAWVRNGQAELRVALRLPDQLRQGRRRAAGGQGHQPRLSIVADDTAMTLKVTLEQPYADFPAVVTHTFFMPLPEKVVSKLTDQTQWDKGLMIGNGPFMMDAPPTSDMRSRWSRNDKLGRQRLGDTKAMLDKMVFKVDQGRRVGLHRLRVGRGHVGHDSVGQVRRSPDQIQQHHQGADSSVRTTSTSASTDPQLGGDKNIKLRQAISLAVDRDQINKKVYEGVRTDVHRHRRRPASPASRPASASTAPSTSPRPRRC